MYDSHVHAALIEHHQQTWDACEQKRSERGDLNACKVASFYRRQYVVLRPDGEQNSYRARFNRVREL